MYSFYALYSVISFKERNEWLTAAFIIAVIALAWALYRSQTIYELKLVVEVPLPRNSVLLPPIIYDFDNDGMNEILIATAARLYLINMGVKDAPALDTRVPHIRVCYCLSFKRQCFVALGLFARH